MEKSLLANPELTLILISHHLTPERKKQFTQVYNLQPVAPHLQSTLIQQEPCAIIDSTNPCLSFFLLKNLEISGVPAYQILKPYALSLVFPLRAETRESCLLPDDHLIRQSGGAAFRVPRSPKQHFP